MDCEEDEDEEETGKNVDKTDLNTRNDKTNFVSNKHYETDPDTKEINDWLPNCRHKKLYKVIFSLAFNFKSMQFMFSSF